MILDIESKIINKAFELTHFHSAINYYWTDGFVFSGESHDFWEMVCVISGSIQETEDSSVYTLEAGDVVFHAPMEFHSLVCSKDVNTHVLVISFSVKGKLPENISDGIFSLTVNEIAEYKELFEKIFSFMHKTDNPPFLPTECCYDLSSYILKLARNHKTKNRILSSENAKIFNALVNLMNEMVYENLSLLDFATAKNISISQLKVIFRKFAGISPKAYYSKLKCNECMRLLQEGISPTEITKMMNFSSLNYFSVFFKNLTGMTPTNYIKTL